MHEVCLREQDWGRLWQLVKTHTDHVIEGDKVGGFRDRVYSVELKNKELEKEIASISKGRWIIGIVSGVIGGLIGSGSKDAIVMVVNYLVGK